LHVKWSNIYSFQHVSNKDQIGEVLLYPSFLAETYIALEPNYYHQFLIISNILYVKWTSISHPYLEFWISPNYVWTLEVKIWGSFILLTKINIIKEKVKEYVLLFEVYTQFEVFLRISSSSLFFFSKNPHLITQASFL
jgi:hypothetical protein